MEEIKIQTKKQADITILKLLMENMYLKKELVDIR